MENHNVKRNRPAILNAGKKDNIGKLSVFLYTVFALVTFAFNSLLCRMALRGDEIDAASFTAVRLVSGAITLTVISFIFSRHKPEAAKGNWISAFFLFTYAICFSFAYIGLTAATGALILFGCVQMTMILAATIWGEKPSAVELLGLAAALGGLVYLVLPGLSSPPPLNAGLMAAAGTSWGIYTMRGRSSGGPLANTTGNFVRTLPFMLLTIIPFVSRLNLSNRGVVLAVLSGAVASGIGYSVWYSVLKHHTPTRAAILQLSVPVIAAAGGVFFLAEAATIRLWIADGLILGGILLTIFGRR